MNRLAARALCWYKRFRCESLRFASLTLSCVVWASGCAGAKVGDAGQPPGEQSKELPPLLLSETGERRTVRISFHITNGRLAPMTLQLVDRSCGCQQVDLPEQPIRPSESATVSMIIAPAPKAEKKAYQATLRLVWKEQPGLAKLRAELEVLPDVRVEPTELKHAFVSEDACQQNLTIKQRVRSEAAPNAVEPNLTDLPEDVELITLEHVRTGELYGPSAAQGPREFDPSGTEWPEPLGSIWEIEWRAALRVKCTDRVRAGFVGQFTVSFSGSTASSVQIPIQLRRLDPVQLAPPYTYFGRVGPGEERKRIVMLHALDGKEFVVSNISCDSPAFEGHVAIEESRKLHNVQVLFRSSEGGQHTGTFRIATTHPNCPEVRFSVEGSVAESLSVDTPNVERSERVDR